MKLSIILALAGLACAAPAPAIEVVWVTQYYTVQETVIGGQTTIVPVADSTSTTAAAAAPTTSAVVALAVEDTKPTATVAPSVSSLASPTSTATSAAPTASASPSGSVFSGQGTYYDVGLGACGNTNSDSEYVVAISHFLYEPETPNGNPNNNPLCGQKIRAYYEGKSVDVTVVDQCMGCQQNDLDFSPSAFSQIADEGLGRIEITWEWL